MAFATYENTMNRLAWSYNYAMAVDRLFIFPRKDIIPQTYIMIDCFISFII